MDSRLRGNDEGEGSSSLYANSKKPLSYPRVLCHRRRTMRPCDPQRIAPFRRSAAATPVFERDVVSTSARAATPNHPRRGAR